MQAGTEMEINSDPGALREEPAPEEQLDELLSQITDANQPGEADWGEPPGVEAW